MCEINPNRIAEIKEGSLSNTRDGDAPDMFLVSLQNMFQQYYSQIGFSPLGQYLVFPEGQDDADGSRCVLAQYAVFR